MRPKSNWYQFLLRFSWVASCYYYQNPIYLISKQHLFTYLAVVLHWTWHRQYEVGGHVGWSWPGRYPYVTYAQCLVLNHDSPWSPADPLLPVLHQLKAKTLELMTKYNKSISGRRGKHKTAAEFELFFALSIQVTQLYELININNKFNMVR